MPVRAQQSWGGWHGWKRDYWAGYRVFITCDYGAFIMLRYEQTGSLQGGIIRFDKFFRFFLAKGKMCKSTHLFLDVFNDRTDFFINMLTASSVCWWLNLASNMYKQRYWLLSEIWGSRRCLWSVHSCRFRSVRHKGSLLPCSPVTPSDSVELWVVALRSHSCLKA